MATHSAARRAVNAATLRLAAAERELAETAALLRPHDGLPDYPDLAAIVRLAELVGLVRGSLDQWAALAVPRRRRRRAATDGAAVFAD